MSGSPNETGGQRDRGSSATRGWHQTASSIVGERGCTSPLPSAPGCGHSLQTTTPTSQELSLFFPKLSTTLSSQLGKLRRGQPKPSARCQAGGCRSKAPALPFAGSNLPEPRVASSRAKSSPYFAGRRAQKQHLKPNCLGTALLLGEMHQEAPRLCVRVALT